MAQKAQSRSTGGNPLLNILRDERALQIIAQVAFVIVAIIVLGLLANSTLNGLEENNQTPNFSFLSSRAGFEIADSGNYSPSDSYLRAFQVGVVNTLRVVIVGLILTTLLGILVGVFLLSNNWLLRTVSRAFVEILRNTPLLVQIFVWFFVVVLALPVLRESLELPAEQRLIFQFRFLVYIVGALAYIYYLYFTPRLSADRPWRQIFFVGGLTALVFAEAAILESFGVVSGTIVFIIIGVINLLALGLIAAVVMQLGERQLPAQWRDFGTGVIAGTALALVLFGIFEAIDFTLFRLDLKPAIFLSQRGLNLPQVQATARFAEWLGFIIIGVVAAGAIWVYSGRITETTGRPIPRLFYGIIAIIAGIVIGWIIVGIEPVASTVAVERDGAMIVMSVEDAREIEAEEGVTLITPEQDLELTSAPLRVTRPERRGLRFVNTTLLTPEYLAILLALVVYTSAFIAEIVRAGIQAVPRGQVEAARAVGLSQAQVLRLIILPQALRVIIPPLTNQYLNLTKNSSLAVAISFTDIFQVAGTIINQSGQSVSGIAMVMGTYLVFSLVISLVMNLINQRFQLVSR